MKDEWLKVLREMYAEGWAVAVFTPSELDGVPQEKVQDSMIEAGWDCIERLNSEVEI